MEYSKDILKGISWLGILQILFRAISFFRIVIIIKLLGLTQADIGIYAICTLTLAFLEIFTETGINIFLIQKRDTVHHYIDTAWVVSIVRGVLITSVMLLSTPYIAEFFHQPTVSPYLYLMSLVPFLRGFINPSVAIFIKELKFGQEFSYRVGIMVVEFVTGIGLILAMHSIMGLVIGVICGVLYEVAYSFFMVRPIPNFAFEKEKFQEIIRSGRWVSLGGIFTYLYLNVDTIIVGRMLGVASLGLYDTMYKVSILPVTDFTQIINKVTLPVLVKLENSKKMFLTFFKILAGSFVILIPIFFVLYLAPALVIQLVLGPQWLNGVEVLKILAILSIFRSIVVINDAFLLAKEKQKHSSFVKGVSVLLLLVLIVPFIHMYGILGAGYAAVISCLVSVPVSIYFLWKSHYLQA